MPIKAIGVFAGGGAKGFAHVGAYSAALERGIEFKFFAGTSAGSIIASLLGAGYTPAEIYDPEKNTGLLTTDFINILGRFRWCALGAFSYGIFGLLWRIWLWPGAIYILWKLFRRRGIFDSAALEPTFENWLREKVKEPLNGQFVTFRDLPNLKIVGTSLECKGALIWSCSDTPDFSVAKAITASIAIPFIFRPIEAEFSTSIGSQKRLNYPVTDIVVDGGMVSNFPIWVFDEERGDDWDLSTFAFCFNNQTKGKIDSWLSYVRRLLVVAISGDSILEMRQVDNLILVPLDVSLGTLDFDANEEQKRMLFQEGKECTDKAFKNLICPQDPMVVSKLLEALCDDFSTELEKSGVSTELRANVMLKGPRKTLRVSYSYNMDNDADDRLAIRLGSGVCGLAMSSSKPVVIDLHNDQVFAAQDWGLSKYQKAMIKKDLRTIFSIPMLVDRPGEKPEVVGVLNFDSSDPLKEVLKKHFSYGVEAANAVLTLLFHLKVQRKEVADA